VRPSDRGGAGTDGCTSRPGLFRPGVWLLGRRPKTPDNARGEAIRVGECKPIFGVGPLSGPAKRVVASSLNITGSRYDVIQLGHSAIQIFLEDATGTQVR
jgi:hypothetical protein